MITDRSVAQVSLYGVRYEVDLAACRARLLERVAELGVKEGKGGGMELVAGAAGVSRTTLRLFLEGQKVSVESFVAIITRGLNLAVSDVAKAAA
jgi:hypothetical protein